ncbi:hypothetical protein PT287_02165 [Lactobacillus sp. ESL0679]|uniref:hypothetical protein n=1 Tax=unclassified Lactobacillus TaxID=2620435 RepID=UPI0023F74A96|nr:MULTISPECIES: hypothetical protein [unclassified Lactobacillus]MDF7682328.1 hypothetical protein [Lactobacillus sp. ESL0679]WEV36885.1 hypothetical protein OZX76_09120 [Lactobacillus sp. ESL0677]
MKDKNNSKKMKRIIFFIYLVCFVLIMSLSNVFDTQILKLIRSITIFSKLSDRAIRSVYLLVPITVLEMIYQKSIKYFSVK